MAAAETPMYETLDDLFGIIAGRAHKLLQDASDMTDEFVKETIILINKCSDLVRREALFSTNEDLDDIATSYLKYLFLDYYLGKFCLNQKDFDARKSHVMDGLFALNSFVDTCTELKLIHESELKLLSEHEGSESLTAETKRTLKIEKFKRNRANQTRVAQLQSFLAQMKGEHGGEHEDKLRELYLVQLESYSSDAIDEIDMIQQELTMLTVREREQESEQQQQQQQTACMDDSRQRQSEAAKRAAVHANRPGLTVTRTYKENGKLMLSKEVVKATVFGDSIAPPTMTLEEFAMQEVADARAREEAQANAPRAPRRYDQLVAAGDEDDLALVDEATAQDRAWDMFREENPKGWGNKAGKRF